MNIDSLWIAVPIVGATLAFIIWYSIDTRRK